MRWVEPRNQARTDGTHDLRPGCGALSPHGRRHCRARKRLLVPAAASIHGASQGRPSRLRIPRSRVQFRRPLYLYAGAEDHQSGCLGARLSDNRAPSSGLGTGGLRKVMTGHFRLQKTASVLSSAGTVGDDFPSKAAAYLSKGVRALRSDVAGALQGYLALICDWRWARSGAGL